MAVWIIRGGSDWEPHEEEFIDSCSIGIYFGVEGTARRSDDELRREIRDNNLLWHEERGLKMKPSSMNGVVTRFLNQVGLFRDSVQPGDVVLMPRKESRGHMVRRGIVESSYEFWPGCIYPHCRRVKWEAEDVPRNCLPYSWHPSNQRTVFRVS